MSYTTDMPKWLQNLTDELLINLPAKYRHQYREVFIDRLKLGVDLAKIRWRIGTILVDEYRNGLRAIPLHSSDIEKKTPETLDPVSILRALKTLHSSRSDIATFNGEVTDVPSLYLYVSWTLTKVFSLEISHVSED